MRKLVDSFYRDRSIVNHQIASYDDFLEHRLQNIIDSTMIGQEEEMERGFIYPEIEGYKIKFGKITVGTPEVKEADGTKRPLKPMEARLRDLTYEAPLTLEFIPVKDEVEYEPEEVKIGNQVYKMSIKKIEEKELPKVDEKFAKSLNYKNLNELKKKLLEDLKKIEDRRLLYPLILPISKKVSEFLLSYGLLTN